jgi:hypothetical protein
MRPELRGSSQPADVKHSAPATEPGLEPAAKRWEILQGTLAFGTFLGLISLWGWAILQMVQLWEEPLRHIHDQVLSRSDMF